MDITVATKPKKVTYQDPVDENTDYLAPSNYESDPLTSQRTKSNEKSKKPPTGFFGSIYLLISLLLYVGVPISQFVIGFIYIGKCTIRPFLPIYMILSGAFGIMFVTVGLIINIQKNRKSSTSYESSISNKMLLKVLKPIFILLFLFVFGWFITGQVLVFQIKTSVELIESALPEYCHAKLYKAAYVLLFVDYIIIVFAIVLNSLNCISSPDETEKKKPKRRSTRPTRK